MSAKVSTSAHCFTAPLPLARGVSQRRTTADTYRFHGIWHFPLAWILFSYRAADDQKLVAVLCWFAVLLLAFATNYIVCMGSSPHWRPAVRRAGWALARTAGLSVAAALCLAWSASTEPGLSGIVPALQYAAAAMVGTRA